MEGERSDGSSKIFVEIFFFSLSYKCFAVKPKSQFCRSRSQKSEQAHLGATNRHKFGVFLCHPPFGHVMYPFMPLSVSYNMPPSAHYMAKVYVP